MSLREIARQAAEKNFSSAHACADAVAVAVAGELLAQLNDRLTAKLTPSLNTGSAMDMLILVSSVFREAQADLLPRESPRQVRCGYCKEMVAPRDPFHVHGYNECMCGELPTHNQYFHAVESPRPPQDETGWQPIETAPKDGTRIRVWCPDSSAERGYQCDAEFVDFKGEIPSGYFHGEKYRDGWCNAWDGDYLDSEPTHWMPLPEAPR